MAKKFKNNIIAAFQAKIGWKRLRKREKIKIIVLFRSYLTRKNKLQKNRKNIQKIKNTIIASFQAKIGWKMLRKRGNKNHRSIPFLPDLLEKIPKKLQKNSKV